LDDDGYTLICGDQEASLSANGTKVVEGLDPDTYQAELIGLADNCTVGDGGQNSTEFEFVILPSDTTSLEIQVSCESQSQT